VSAWVIRTSCGSAGSRSTSSSSRITRPAAATDRPGSPTPWRCGSVAVAMVRRFGCRARRLPPVRATAMQPMSGCIGCEGDASTRGVYIVGVQRFSVDPRIVGCQRLVSDRARAPRLPRGLSRINTAPTTPRHLRAPATDSTVSGHWSYEEVFQSKSPVVQRVLSLRAYGVWAWTTAMSRHWPISLRNVPANICPGAIRG
jgi:hypothetical protein